MAPLAHIKHLLLFAVLFATLSVALPTHSYATPPEHVKLVQERLNWCKCESGGGSANITVQNCSSAGRGGLVSTVVYCVQETLVIAMDRYLVAFTNILAPTVWAVFIFSMILIGFKIFGGQRELDKEVALYIIKFGLVVWFVNNLGGFAHAPFAIVHDITRMVSTGLTGDPNMTPWGAMDKFFCKFFGTECTREGSEVYRGVMGLAGAALFSGYMGILIFIMSMLAMITSVYFIFRAIYTYLAAITLIAFIIILSPLFVPLAMFARTTRYLYKWLDYLIAAMLHPVLLFAFLSMFLSVLQYMLSWFIGLMGGNDFSSYWRNNTNLSSWVLNSDPRAVEQLGRVLGEEPSRTAVQSFASPAMLNAVNTNPMSMFSLDFGADQVLGMQILVFGFLSLFITSYLLLSMVNYLPRISEAIAGVVIGLEVKGIPFVNEIKYMWEKVKGSAGTS